MIVFNGIELIGYAAMGVLLVLCVIASIADRIARFVEKRQQKRIDDAYNEDGDDKC